MRKYVTPKGNFSAQTFPLDKNNMYLLTDEEAEGLKKHTLKWSKDEAGKPCLVSNDTTEEKEEQAKKAKILPKTSLTASNSIDLTFNEKLSLTELVEKLVTDIKVNTSYHFTVTFSNETVNVYFGNSRNGSKVGSSIRIETYGAWYYLTGNVYLSGIIDGKTVGDMRKAEFVTKGDVYTKEEVTELLKSFNSVEFKVVDNLPSAGEKSVIYLVPRAKEGYTEYLWIESVSKYEEIGDTLIDLSGYVKKENGKGLSTNDFTDEEKNKLDNLQEDMKNKVNRTELGTQVTYSYSNGILTITTK